MGLFSRSSQVNGAAATGSNQRLATSAESAHAEEPFTTLLSGDIPTPWRHKPVRERYKNPEWLPHYWWACVDFTADIFRSQDFNYDDNLLKMMPKWLKVIMV